MIIIIIPCLNVVEREEGEETRAQIRCRRKKVLFLYEYYYAVLACDMKYYYYSA